MPPRTYDFNTYKSPLESGVTGFGKGFGAVEDINETRRSQALKEAIARVAMQSQLSQAGRENVEAGGDAPDSPLSSVSQLRGDVGRMLGGNLDPSGGYQAPTLQPFKKTHESQKEMEERSATERERIRTDASKFTFGQGTDKDGNPMIWSGNTRTGDAQLTDVGGKVGGTGDSRQQAQLDVARNTADSADQQMLEYEKRLRKDAPNHYSIGATEAWMAKRVFKGGDDATYAESYLAKHNPDLLKYVKNAKAIGVSERLITPRGGSNFLTDMENALSGAGPNAPDEDIERAQRYRHALVSGLKAHGSRRAASSEGGDDSQLAKKQGLWDAAVAKYGREKVESEYGPRP